MTKVLITAPSLNEDENVSGIGTLVRNLTRFRASDYVHFEAGRKDSESADAEWVIRQAALPFRFFAAIKRHAPDIVHVNTAFNPLSIIRDMSLAAAARMAGRPVLLHIHGGTYVIEEIRNPALKGAARNLIKMSKAVIVFSEREAVSIANSFPGTKVHVLPNAVPLEVLEYRDRGEGEKIMIFFGRMHESKGLRHIVAACRALNEQGFKFEFVAYGAGPEKEYFVSEMNSFLGKNFSFRGVAKGDDKWRALSEADIFFLPSRDEGLPIALLEAMAVGCVPVISVSGAVADVIEDGHNGFLIEAGNTIQTVGRLKVLLSESSSGWNALRENAGKTIREKYDFAKYLSKLDAIYEETAAKK